jgi:hypothetical protein
MIKAFETSSKIINILRELHDLLNFAYQNFTNKTDMFIFLVR